MSKDNNFNDAQQENEIKSAEIESMQQLNEDIFMFFENSDKPKAPPMVKTREEAVKLAQEKRKIDNSLQKDVPVNKNSAVLQAEAPKKEKNKINLWFSKLSKPKKAIFCICIILLCLCLILVSIASIFVKDKLNKLGGKVNPYIYDDTIYDDLDMGSIEIDIGSEGFKQSLIDWATQGNDNHMYSKNVINVLLIGADSRAGVNEGNTDVMMIVSVNKKAKTLKMISLLRDSYLYVEGTKYTACTKLNAAFSMGGPACLIQTIENNYKITIDDYVMVNFESFKDIVDAMDGITVDVQEYEAREVERYFGFSMPYGDGVTLTGKQALAFCRIRKCDSDGDVSRTRRQRQVIDSMMDRLKNSTVTELNKYIDVFLPYVATGFTESEIINLGLNAITGGWVGYDRTEYSVPVTKYDDPEKTAIAGDANMWIWVVDYQKAAHDLQIEIYGESNIELEETRVSLIDIYNGAEYSGSSSSSSGANTTKPVTTTAPTTQPQTTVPETTENNDVPPVTDSDESTQANTGTDDTTVSSDIPDTTEGATTVTEPIPTTEGTTSDDKPLEDMLNE